MKNSFSKLGILATVFFTFAACEVEEFKEFDKKGTEKNLMNKGLSADGYVNFADNSRLKTFWMRYDHEPWNRGNAEVYAFMIGLDRNRNPLFSKVRMPYANHDGEVYYIDQKLIDWSKGYAGGMVNIIFTEADDTIPTTLIPGKFPADFEDGEFSNIPIHQALNLLTNSFKNSDFIAPDGSFISPEDDIVDVFRQVSRYRDYNVVGGELDNAYITLEREFN